MHEKVLQGELLGTPEISSTDSVPTGVCRQKLWGLIFLTLEPWAVGSGVRLGLLAPKISLPVFYLPYMDVGTTHFMSLPLLPVWMDVVSLIPQLSDFHST